MKLDEQVLPVAADLAEIAALATGPTGGHGHPTHPQVPAETPHALRLLLIGDLATTGFGTVTMDLGRALLARGVDCRFLSLNEMVELPEMFAGRTAMLGQGWLAFDGENATQASDRINHLFTGGAFEDGWAPEQAVIIGDAGSLLGNPVLSIVPQGFPLWHYVPIEGIGLPPAWLSIWAVAKPIAMCEFGADEIAKLTGTRPPVVYHGVDTDVFRPATPLRPIVAGGRVLRSRGECRRLFGGDPTRTWLLRTDRYMPRKAYPSLLRSVMPVLAAHPEVDMVIHCRPRDEGGDIRVELSKYGALANRVLLTGLGGRLPREGLVALYNAADLYVSTSAEGFGLTVAEALACGIPAVGLDYSSVPEVIGSAGTVVPVGSLMDNPYSYFWALPNEAAYTEAVEFLVTHKHKREQLGMLGAMRVKSKFQWSRAAEQFEAILAPAVVEVAA
jgi:glycosyltransferase involved in cell wall biosynthesis